MAKAVLVCWRDPRRQDLLEIRVRHALTRLSPRGATAMPTMCSSAPGLCMGVLNPPPSGRCRGTNILLGDPVPGGDGWLSVGAALPDGASAVMRADDDCVELLTDGFGSRTLWWRFDEEVFVASTSQRAIFVVTGSFAADQESAAWFLSAGFPGPDRSWDSRLRRLAPAQRLRLDRQSWDLVLNNVSRAAPEPVAHEGPACADLVERALRADASTYCLSARERVLALSGGRDSRSILLAAPDSAEAHCLSWGMHARLDDPAGDVSAARRVAASVGAAHSVAVLDDDQAPIERVCDAFVVNSEAGHDNLAGYVDCFRVWERVVAGGATVVVRGDSPFCEQAALEAVPMDAGANAVGSAGDEDSPSVSPAKTGLAAAWGSLRFLEYRAAEVRALAEEFPDQEWPRRLWRMPGEAPAVWRDRLHLEYACYEPALTDTKAAYVETGTPLRRAALCAVARDLGGRFANAKYPFAVVAERLEPRVPFAHHASVSPLAELVRRADMARFLSDSLGDAMDVLPRAVVSLASRRFEAETQRARGRGAGVVVRRPATRLLWRAVPDSIRHRAAYRRATATVDPGLFALRCVLAAQALRLFAEDAAEGRRL